MRGQRLTLAAVCLGTFMLLLDLTIVNVAMPDIARGLGASFTDLQWVIDGYALSVAALLLTAGTVADRNGRRLVFALGVVLFTAASGLCAAASSPGFLVAMRCAQGIGGAMMFATALALIGHGFEGRARATAFAVWGGTTGIAVAIGPLLGGALTSGLSWRWIFLVNLPIGLLTLLLALRAVPESRDPHPSPLDLGGFVTFSAGAGLLVLGLIRSTPDGWGSTTVVASLAGAAACLLAFAVVELRHDAPMFDLGLLARPAFLGVSIAAFAVSATILALILFLVIDLQGSLGYSAWGVGLRLLPLSGAILVAGAIAGRAGERLRPGVLLGGGLLTVGVGLLLLRGLDADSSWTALLAGLIVSGAGVGLINPTLASAAVDVVDRERAGMASGINTTFRQLGIATGIAVLGSLFTSSVHDRVVQDLAPAMGSQRAGALADRLTSGGPAGASHGAPPPVAHAVHDAFAAGIDELALVAAIVVFAAAVLTVVLTWRQQAPAAAAEPGGAGRRSLAAA